MENIQSFLNTSSINGLNHISNTQNLSKLFWIFVVFIGFTLSGVLIHQSFEAWKQSPISTTIESVPIAEITFPKVTVCPPKNISDYRLLSDNQRMTPTYWALTSR